MAHTAHTRSDSPSKLGVPAAVGAFSGNMSIAKKYVIAPVLLVMIGVIIAVTGFMGMRQQYDGAQHMYDQHVVAIRTLGDVQADFGDVRRQAYQHLVADTPEKKRNFDALITTSFAKF